MDLDLNIELIFPELILIVFSCFILMLSLFYRLNAQNLKSLSVLSLMLATFTQINQGLGESFFSLFLFDELARYSSILINLCAMFFILADKRAEKGEFFALFLMMIACLNFLVSSNNLLMIFITLEGSSLALYSLIAFRDRAISSAIVYFNYGMLSSAFFAFGAAMYYFDSGNLELNSLEHFSTASLISFVMIGSAILFKLSIVPFHMWLKDVYYEARPALAGFISVTPKLAIMVFAYRYIMTFNNYFGVGEFILCISCLSMLFASIFALKQENAKGMLVYSSISHSSFAYAALCISDYAMSGFMYYFLAFAFVNMALFMFIGAFKDTEYCYFKGVFKKHPLLGISIIILLLNLAAIPPFGVFFAKVYIINIAINYSVFATGIMAISSVIMLIAYLRFIRAIMSDGDIEYVYFNNTQKILFIISLIASVATSFGIDYLV